MRWIFWAVLSGTLILGASDAPGQGFSSVDAINRCEAFVESALRPELSAQIKHPYKISCYFGLTDPEIHQDHRVVCDKISRPMADPHREIAAFMCLGAYARYLEEIGLE